MLCITLTTTLYAQLHLRANIQNMHLWRGIEVADGLVITTDLYWATLDDQLKLGFWGGSNVNGTYKEFNYYASYSYKALSIALSDTYNFSPAATYNNTQFFNYDPSETGRFLDATIAYNFTRHIPLTLSYSTILFGRDRDTNNAHNIYSSFLYAEYQLYNKEQWQLDAGLGAAFALDSDDGSHFYGEQAGVVHLATRATRNLDIGSYQLPIFVCAMWNPMTDSAHLQLGVQLMIQ